MFQCFFLLGIFIVPSSKASKHCLDPLTALEITATSNAIKQTYPEVDFMFIRIDLREPKKSNYLQYFLADTDPPDGQIPRESSVTLINPATKIAYQAVVNLTDISAPELNSFMEVPRENFPGFANGEEKILNDIVLEDSKVKKRLSKYGKEFADRNSSLVVPDVW